MSRSQVSRPFAYNTGYPISGTEQVGNIAIGTPDVGFELSGVQWWNGPDESVGYVIAKPNVNGDQHTPVSGVFAHVAFLRSADLTDASFIELVNVHFHQNFSTANDAKSYLTTNNYWTSFGGFTLYGNGDITYNTQRYGGYSSTTNTGFVCDGTRDTYNGIVYNLTGSLPGDISAVWTAAGLDTNNAYVWNITWATGGSIVARVALNPDNISNSIAIVPIDQTDTRWQSGAIGGPTLAGTFEFPATFTPYIPTTQISSHTDWC